MSQERPDPVVAKRLLICDRIEGRADGGVNLINLWLLKRLPRGWRPGEVVPPFAAFAWLTNGRGSLTFRIEVVASDPAGRQQGILRSRLYPVTFADPLETQFLCLTITALRIQSSGDFSVELYCEDEQHYRYFLDSVRISFEDHP
jgi:hypothetical protein